MMDNLNLKPQSPDEVKTMMWTGENQREMFDLLTCGKKIDDYMTASGENFFIDHSTVKGGLVLITNIGNQRGCEIPVKIGDYVCPYFASKNWVGKLWVPGTEKPKASLSLMGASGRRQFLKWSGL